MKNYYKKCTQQFRTALISAILLSVMSHCVVASDLHFRGSWVQGGVLIGQTQPGTQVIFNQRNIPVSSEGFFVLGLSRDAGTLAKVKTVSADGQVKNHQYSITSRKFNIQDIKGVPQKTVTPDPEQVARAQREAQLTAKARSVTYPFTYFSEKFEWPLTGRISGVYGSQRIYNGVAGNPHWGVDIARPTGTRVKAPAQGLVTLVHGDMFYSGGTLIIDHGHGLSSTFIHLSKILVEEGETIKAGDEIAEVGATGRATGPHLDWRMNWFEERVDPTTLVGPMPSY